MAHRHHPCSYDTLSPRSFGGTALTHCSTVRYVPEWLPGAGFKKLARRWNARMNEFYDKPLEFVKHQLVGLNEAYDSSNFTKLVLTIRHRVKPFLPSLRTLWRRASMSEKARASLSMSQQHFTLEDQTRYVDHCERPSTSL